MASRCRARERPVSTRGECPRPRARLARFAPWRPRRTSRLQQVRGYPDRRPRREQRLLQAVAPRSLRYGRVHSASNIDVPTVVLSRRTVEWYAWAVREGYASSARLLRGKSLGKLDADGLSSRKRPLRLPDPAPPRGRHTRGLR